MTDLLLEELEAGMQEEVEPVWIPQIANDPLLTIGSILQKRPRRHLELAKLPGKNLGMDVAAQYLVENLPTERVAHYLKKPDEETLPKLILTDLMATHEGEYALDQPLEQLAMEIALDAYVDSFSELCRIVYTERPKAKKKASRIAAPAPPPAAPPVGEDAFQYYRGKNLPTAIAAAQIKPLVEGLDERLRSVQSVKELKCLIAANIYHGMVRMDAVKEKIKEYMMNPECRDDLFLCSVLYVHKDLFECLEG